MKLPGKDNLAAEIKKGSKVEKGQVMATLEERSVYYIDLVGILKGWSTEKLNQWKSENIGKEFADGAVVIESGGMFPKKVHTERQCVLIDIDEFGRAKFAYEDGDVKKVKAPVGAVVQKIETDKLTLGFEAVEVKGDGNGKGKTWGDGIKKKVSEASQMKAEMEGKVVFVDGVDQVKISKAEVIGVAALVIISDKAVDWDEFVCDLPAVVISNEKYEYIRENIDLSNCRMMLNSNSGRLLVVVQ